jgi:hypothetical protein
MSASHRAMTGFISGGTATSSPLVEVRARCAIAMRSEWSKRSYASFRLTAQAATIPGSNFKAAKFHG